MTTEAPEKIVAFSAYADFTTSPGHDAGCHAQVLAATVLAETLNNNAIYFFPNTIPFGNKSYGQIMAEEFMANNAAVDPKNVIFFGLDSPRKVVNSLEETTALNEQAHILGTKEQYIVAALYHRRRVRIDSKRVEPKTRTMQAELIIRSTDNPRIKKIGEIVIAELHSHPAYNWKVFYEQLVTAVDQVPVLGPIAQKLVERLTNKQLAPITTRIAAKLRKR